MTTWTSEELNKIGTAEELQIASLRRDGTLRKPVIIWVVRLGDDLYVRSVNGRTMADSTYNIIDKPTGLHNLQVYIEYYRPEAIDTDVDVAFWSHALKNARRHLRHLLAALRPLWSLLDSAVADVDALDDVTAASYGPAPPPRPVDPTTSPHRPCAPPALLTRGHEWLPRVGAVGAPTERERVAILTG